MRFKILVALGAVLFGSGILVGIADNVPPNFADSLILFALSCMLIELAVRRP